MIVKITGSIRARLIVLVLLFPFLSLAQNVVSGRIISVADQTPIPGATVLVSGSKAGTSTDVEGRFSIKAKTGDVLVITGVGITKQEYTVGVDTRNIVISVVAEEQNLNEAHNE